MGFWADMKLLYQFTFKPIRGHDHAERLESFYVGQAHGYDDFRRRFLQGRAELWKQIDIPRNGIWVDLGAGTGSNLEFLGDRIHDLKKIYLLDLAPSLLNVARQRVERQGWKNVEIIEGDATSCQPCQEPVDVITFSYSLTMIPDWFTAIEHAKELLRPDGLIGVVDFYVARKYPPPNLARHGSFTRRFWTWFFARENVFLSSDHLPFLQQHFEVVSLSEHRSKVPYVPFVKVPYYRFLGRKRL